MYRLSRRARYNLRAVRIPHPLSTVWLFFWTPDLSERNITSTSLGLVLCQRMLCQGFGFARCHRISASVGVSALAMLAVGTTFVRGIDDESSVLHTVENHVHALFGARGVKPPNTNPTTLTVHALHTRGPYDVRSFCMFRRISASPAASVPTGSKGVPDVTERPTTPGIFVAVGDVQTCAIHLSTAVFGI